MDQKQLNAIKERVGNATPGEWRSMDTGHVRTHYSVGNEEEFVAHTYDVNDAEFIANAHKDVPALVAEVERLQKRLAQTEKCYEIMEKATFKATDKINSFKKALEFYASENNHFRADMHAESLVMQDAGEKARQALGGESK
ncbi:ead/Ea22-like family protein [Lysinibacillus sp. NPDC092081]|uniref:ead/Ea22-like family protein n=1 Tax=Lysinibacillus sp. NPDC092081 TaxID=3364131 RepID=UPI003830ABBF